MSSSKLFHGFALVFIIACGRVLAGPTLEETFPPNIAQLIIWERQFNPVLKKPRDRTTDVFEVPYFSIPEKYLTKVLGEKIDPKILAALTVPDGEGNLLYPIHPDDTEFFHEVEAALKKIEGGKFAKVRKSDRLLGARTASRSVIVKTGNGAIFSLKLSTNATPGWAQTKPVTPSAAHDILGITRLISKLEPLSSGSNIVFQRDPVLLRLTESPTQAVLGRTLGGITSDPNTYYLPGFSVFTDAGRDIARANGEDPMAFWSRHFAGPMGKAMAEFAVNYGFIYDSPHMQNFLIEMKKENGVMKPTGRVVFRDLGDVQMIDEFHKRLRLDVKLQADVPDVHISFRDFSIGAAFFDKMPKPPEGSEAFYDAFFKSFEGELKTRLRASGLDTSALEKVVDGAKRPGGSWRKRYLIPDSVSLRPVRQIAARRAARIPGSVINHCALIAELSPQ